MLNVLITGSTGFIGNHLKNSFEGKFNLILPSREDLTMESLFNNVDIVIHLAGKAHDIDGVDLSNEYNIWNTKLTNDLYDRFLISDSSVFIFMSTILVSSSNSSVPLTEEMIPNPISNYAKSKYESEIHISQSKMPHGKRYYILRTPLVYGNGNKGNLMLLYNFIKKITFWPLGNYHSERSFCDVRNLSFVIEKLISIKKIENGIYHIADDYPFNLNDLYVSLAKFFNKRPIIVRFPKLMIHFVFLLGSLFNLSFNLNRLKKITSSLLVSNKKIKTAIGSDMPHGSIDDLLQSFKN